MIGIALRALDAKRNHHETMAAVRASRLEEAAKDATEHVMEDWEEWNLADNEESDGGAPVPMLRQDEKLVPSKPGKGDSNVLKAEREAKEKLEAKTQDDEEAARLAIAVGDDVGAENSDSADSKGSFPGNIVVKQTVLDWQRTVEADNHSSPAPMWAPNDADEQIDSALEDNSTPEGAIHTADETSPIAAHIEERLAFLESLDTEDGGVKL